MRAPDRYQSRLRWFVFGAQAVAGARRTARHSGRRSSIPPAWRSISYSPDRVSDLFAAAVREWPWLPHFEHLLIDLSAAAPETVEAVRGELKVRVALFTMMAAYRDRWQLLQRVLPLLT